MLCGTFNLEVKGGGERLHFSRDSKRTQAAPWPLERELEAKHRWHVSPAHTFPPFAKSPSILPAATSMSATIELSASDGENVRLTMRLLIPLVVQPPRRSCILSLELLKGSSQHRIRARPSKEASHDRPQKLHHVSCEAVPSSHGTT